MAAIIVVLFHTDHGIFDLPKYFGRRQFGILLDFGPGALDFFFVLSGFIILHVHRADIDRPAALGAYLWRRFSRVYLFYWVILAGVMLIFFFVPQFGLGFQRDPDVIIRSIFLFPHPEFHMVVGVAWTMVYEILFYCLFAVLILNKRLGLSLFLIWAIGLLALPRSENYLWNFVFSDIHLRFLLGMGACMLLARGWIPAPRLVAGLGAALFAATAAWHNLEGASLAPVFQLLGYALGSAMLIAGLAQAERDGLVPATPAWLAYLGTAAYSIYLVHFFALSAIAKVSKVLQLELYLPLMVLFFLHVVGSIGVGCLCHHLVENPIHNWTKRFFRRVRPVVIVPVATVPEVREAA